MPQRFLRPGIRTSDRFNSVSRTAQVLFVAILTLVDDYGRYDGRPGILCADAFTIWNEKHPDDIVTPQDCAAESCALQRALLVDFYEVDGKKCLQVLQWEERVRENAKEKWPKNPNPLRNPAESCGILPPSSPPSPPPSPSPTPPPARVTPSENGARVEQVLKAAGKVAEKLRVPEQAGRTDSQQDINLTALQRIEERLNQVYKRPATQRWDCDEEQQLVQIAKRDGVLDEMAHIFYYRGQMPSDERRRFFPQSVRALLNNWGPTLDKARVQCPRPSEKKAAPKQPTNLKPFVQSPELAKKFREAAKV
jgi:hypothetical protein